MTLLSPPPAGLRPAPLPSASHAVDPGISPDAADVPWDLLTRMETKRRAFAVDVDFRYGLHRIRARGIDIQRFAWDFGLLILKPETFYSQKVEASIGFVRSNGFKIVASEVTRFSNALVAQMWRHQLNAATPCRLDLLFDVVTERPILVALVRRPRAEMPTALLLSQFKGSGFPEKRDPAKLRGFLAGPNSYLNSAHASDEPADVVREAALLLPPQAYDRWLDLCATPAEDLPDADPDWAAVRAAFPRPQPSDLDPTAALDRVCKGLAEIGAPAAIARRYEAAARGEGFATARELLDAIRGHRDRFDEWDLCLVISQYTFRTYQNVSQTVGIGTADAWSVRDRHEEA